MSVIINVDQSPLTITPSNGEHIFTLSSSGYTLTNFKYLVDIYLQYTSTSKQYMCRLKVRPNSYGKAIIELEDIVRTFLKANPRFSGTTYPNLNYVAEENSIITLSDAQEARSYNAFNLWPGGSPNANLPQLWHVAQYQVYVGCEYESGSNIVTEMDNNASFQPLPITIFPGVDNALIPQPYFSAATLGSGYTQSPNFFQVANQSWYYYELFSFFYQKPTNGCAPGKFLNAGSSAECDWISQDGFQTQNFRRRKHHIDCPMIVSFLNGKNDYFTNDIYSIAVRSAKEYGDPYTYSAEVANRISTTLPLTNEPIDSTFRLVNFYLPYNVTDGAVLNAIPTDSRKVCFYGTSYSASKNDRLNIASATTEILEYYIQDKDCINEPIHLLFLNGRGMWDTYTFGKKSTKTIDVERKKYQQQSSIDKQFYARGSSQRGQNVYEQNASYSVKCNSWFMDQEDVVIVEELFMSPEVYMIKGNVIQDQECQSCLEEIRLYEYLIPVVIEDRSLVAYQRQYQKIFQYELTLRYGSVKRFRTQG
jgi:hypothetical protein